MEMRSMHIIGSRHLGGAESFYLRLVRGLDALPEHRALAVTRPGGELVAALANGPARCGVGLRNGWDVLSVLSIRRLVREIQPDIVQTYMGRATRLTRLPRDCSAMHVARLGGFYKIDGYYRHADAWVGNTKELCDYMVQQGLPAQRVHHIGNFVELRQPTDSAELARLRNSLRIPEEALVIFALGRFIAKKGFGNLLCAFAGLDREVLGRPLFLVVAGDGPLKDLLQAQAVALEVSDRVRWAGWQTDPAPYFDLADLFVCPSIHEPLGNVILEAWAHRKPVLSTATHGAFELISEGENGLLTPIDDARRMTQTLAELLRPGPDLWRQLGDKGHAFLLARHSKEAVVGQYLDLYRTLHRQGAAGGGF